MAKRQRNAKKLKEEAGFSFDDLNNLLGDVSPLGSTMDVNTFSEVPEYIDTGNYKLNACISGSLFKGYPVNRALEVAGDSGTGKTFLLLNGIKNFVNKGYHVIFYDSENAVDNDLMVKFGIDTSKVRYEPVMSVENFRHMITFTVEKMIEIQRTGKEIPKLLFILDSVGNMPSEKEIRDAKDNNQKADMTRAKTLKSIFRIIINRLAEIKGTFLFSNHVYVTQDFIPQPKAGGGTGPVYAASTILFLSKAKLKDGTKDAKGRKTQNGIVVTAKPNKNRFVKPVAIKFHIDFNKGMNPYVGLEEYLEWDICGVGKGKLLTEREFSKLKESEQKKVESWFVPELDDKKKEIKDEEGNVVGTTYYFMPNSNSTKMVAKHLNRYVEKKEIFTSTLFSQEVLEAIDEWIQPDFNYGTDEDIPEDELFDLEEQSILIAANEDIS